MTGRLSNETEAAGRECSARALEIKRNIEAVRARIASAARRAGRDPETVTLVAVTKTMPASDVAAALESGVWVFGENRVQELLAKLPELDLSGREAHLIGHLQTNKVRQIITKVTMIQSVDSLRLAAEIDRQANAAGVCMDVLLEVNIGGEESKSGVRPEDLPALLEGIAPLRGVRVRGLMAIPPVCADPGLARHYFEQMRKLFIDIGSKKSDNISMHVLSMGMSSDFETAVEEGSTMVRVGTAIFGRR